MKLNIIERTSKEIPIIGGDITNWTTLDNYKLYRDNGYALEYLKNSYFEYSGISIKKKIIFHAYWYGIIDRKQAFSIKSFICTQDTSNCELYLWIDQDTIEDFHANPYLKPLLSYITIKIYNPNVEAKGTSFEYLKDRISQTEFLAERADAFRFLILYKYGGLYFDLDIMFLKNMLPLMVNEFCYPWEQQVFANSAILYLEKKSKLASYLIKKCLRKREFVPWVILNYADLRLRKMFLYPCAFFDPLWQQQFNEENIIPFKEFSDFFRPFGSDFKQHTAIKNISDFFPGCFAYHWHNQWDKETFENSYFGLFDKEFDIIIESRQVVSASSIK